MKRFHGFQVFTSLAASAFIFFACLIDVEVVVAQQAAEILWDRYGAIDGIGSLAVSLTPPTIYITGGTYAQTCPIQLGQWPVRAEPDIDIAAPKMPNGDSELIVSGGGELDAWNPKTNTVREVWATTDGVSSIDFIDVSNDGSQIAVLTFADTVGGLGSLHLIDRSSGKEVWSILDADEMARFSPDGKLLLVSMGGDARNVPGLVLIDVASGSIIKQYSQFLNPAWGMVWDPVRPGVFAIASGNISGIMDTSDQLLANAPMGGGAHGNFLDFSPDGAYVAAEDAGGIDLFCLSDSVSSFIPADGNIFTVAFLNNDTLVAGQYDFVKIFSASKGASIRTLTGFGASGLAFSGDGTKLVCEGGSGLIDAKDGETIGIGPYDGGGKIISYDGTTVVDFDDEGGIYFWTQSLDTFVTLHSDVTDTAAGSCAAFSPTDSLFACAVDILESDTLYDDIRNAVQLWSVKDRKIIRQFVGPHYYPIISIAFSNDGSLLAACSEYDGTYVWNTYTGQLISQNYSSGSNMFFLPGDTSILVPVPSGDPFASHFGLAIYSLSGHNPIYRPNQSITSFQFALTSDGQTCLGLLPGGVQVIDVNTGNITQTIPTPDSGTNACIAVNPVTGDFAVGGEDLIVYKALSTAGVKQFSSSSEPPLEAFASNSHIKIDLPVGAESGRVFVYRTDGRCFFSSEVEAGESSVATSELPSGVYFIVYEPSSGQRAFTKVSLFE